MSDETTPAEKAINELLRILVERREQISRVERVLEETRGLLSETIHQSASWQEQYLIVGAILERANTPVDATKHDNRVSVHKDSHNGVYLAGIQVLTKAGPSPFRDKTFPTWREAYFTGLSHVLQDEVSELEKFIASANDESSVHIDDLSHLIKTFQDPKPTEEAAVRWGYETNGEKTLPIFHTRAEAHYAAAWSLLHERLEGKEEKKS